MRTFPRLKVNHAAVNWSQECCLCFSGEIQFAVNCIHGIPSQTTYVWLRSQGPQSNQIRSIFSAINRNHPAFSSQSCKNAPEKKSPHRTVSTAARSCRQRCSNFRTSHAALRHQRNSLCRYKRLQYSQRQFASVTKVAIVCSDGTRSDIGPACKHKPRKTVSAGAFPSNIMVARSGVRKWIIWLKSCIRLCSLSTSPCDVFAATCRCSSSTAATDHSLESIASTKEAAWDVLRSFDFPKAIRSPLSCFCWMSS